MSGLNGLPAGEPSAPLSPNTVKIETEMIKLTQTTIIMRKKCLEGFFCRSERLFYIFTEYFFSRLALIK